MDAIKKTREKKMEATTLSFPPVVEDPPLSERGFHVRPQTLRFRKKKVVLVQGTPNTHQQG